MKKLIFFILFSVQAMAEGQRWSSVGPKTIEPEASTIEMGVGWPGISVSYLHGVVPGLNLGLKVGFNYGVEGLFSVVQAGAKAQVQLKWRVVDAERFSLGLTFEPGAFFHSSSTAETLVAVALPLGLRVGFAATSALQIAALIDVPLWIQTAPNSAVNVPVLTGLGFEYFLTSNLLVFVKVQLGPTVRSGRAAEFSALASLGAAVKF
jgi:hypothetical protein